MKISLNWLKRYIDIDIPVDRLSEILTDIGLEVEGVEKFEAVQGGLEGIVVGKVIESGKHPNADKLSLCKVDIGEEELLQIVCGAPNVAADQKVLVATIGTTLYSEGEPWKIKKGKIRGEVSQGMICAEDELGLGTDHSGIMVLPEDVDVGLQARDYFNFEDDYVFDIGLTPNRSDATSHIGVAMDLAAYLKINENWKGSVKMPEYNQFKTEVVTDKVEVIIEDEERCPRYSGVCFENVEIKESPQWMQLLLKAIGVRPISNIVDITNFVLHELGQPLHAFDRDKITGSRVRVKTLPGGTSFLSLDEQERKLYGEDLMICDDENNPMCIAGVFGGLNSGVTDDTKRIFLESAHFNASSVRKSSTRHLLRTDAAKIFEKGSDPNITTIALKRAGQLFREYASADITSDIIDVYPEMIEPGEIQLKYSNVCRHIGNKLEKEEIHDILRAMKMELKPVDDDSLLVKVPTNKADVVREIDLIEEILRIYGFNKVDIPDKLRTTIIHKAYPSKRQVQNIISDYLSSNGFNEMMGISLIESNFYDEADLNRFVFINNTSNIHLDIMRPDALVSGLKSIAHNLNHQQTDLKLYELGRTYSKGEGFIEEEFLAVYMCGKDSKESWNNQGRGDTNFYGIKEIVDRVFDKVNLDDFSSDEIQEHPWIEYGLNYSNKMNIVDFGKINKSLLNKMGIQQDVYFALFDFSALVKACTESKIEVKQISRYPSVRRDLALVIDDQVSFAQIREITRRIDKKLITDIGLFDVYKNEKQIGKGKKSYAVKFIFQDFSKTLKDKEVEKIMKKLISTFEGELKAQIRS